MKTPSAFELRAEADRLQALLQRTKEQLFVAEKFCQHAWGAVQANHIYHEGYTIPGDAPGTMGIDWRGPTYVPSRTEKRWTRVCKLCGKTEHTSNTTKHVSETPSFI